MKCTAVSSFGLDPNLSAMAMYYTAADGEPDAGAGILFFIVQPLEYLEDLLVILRVDTNPVVAD